MGPSAAFKPFRTIEELLRLRETAAELKLDAPEEFWTCDAEQLQWAYEGTGVDWQSRLARTWQHALYSEFESAALIHDYFGVYGYDHTEAGFRDWNFRYWLRNGVKICCAGYSWCDWRRYRGLLRVFLLYRVLCRFNCRAWTLLMLMLLLLSLAGCGSLNQAAKNLEHKSVQFEGYVALNRIDTGYDAVSGSFTPKLVSLIGSGGYLSVPSGMEYLAFRREESASVFNAECKTRILSLTLATGDPDRFRAVAAAVSAALGAAE